MRGFRLNRKQKIVRNLLVCALLAACVWAALGCPPYTVRGMCRQVARDYFLEDLEPVYVRREKVQYSGDDLSRLNTFVLARSGETYVGFQFQRHGLQNSRYYLMYEGKMANGALCTAWGGMLYAAGPFADAASATAVVTARQQYADLGADGPAVEFTLEGEKLGNETFAFPYISSEHFITRFWDRRGEVPGPEEEVDLLDAITLWYWEADESGGYSLLNADLPCVVTLYGEDGGVLDVLELEAGVYELHDAW